MHDFCGCWSLCHGGIGGVIMSGQSIICGCACSYRTVICLYGCNMARNVTCCGGEVFPMEGFYWGSLAEVAELFTAVTLCIRAVVTSVACLSTDKIVAISGHYTDCGRCQGGCHLLCCIEFFDQLDDFQ